MRQLADQYTGKITVVGVAGCGAMAAMRRFVELTNVDNIVHLADEQGVVWRRLGVTAQSTYVLLDAAGAIVHRGYLDAADLDRMLAQLAGLACSRRRGGSRWPPACWPRSTRADSRCCPPTWRF